MTKKDDLPTILPQHVIELVARDGWRRQAIADAELQKKLAANPDRPAPFDMVQRGRRIAPQSDLFGGRSK